MRNKKVMKTKKLFVAFALGLGLTLALVLVLSTVEGWLLGGGLPVARAASFTVTKKSDTNDGACDSDCSLREAIVAANSNGVADTITLGLGRFGLTITGTGENASATGDLDITDALIIEGAGPGQTIIDASSLISDRVLDIRFGAGTVVISGVTIMNGNVTGLGGGIYNYDADLTLINTIVSSNVATGTVSDGRGGGVYVYTGNLLLDGAQIISNTAGNSGGGVYVDRGSATLSGGQILSNTASGSGGGVAAYYAGAAFTQTGDSMVAYNIANFHGGGVTVHQAGARFTISGGQIISNSADQWGGGVYIYVGSATLSEGQVTGNTAPYGGGVYIGHSSGVFTQTGGVVAHNTADYGGGVHVSVGSAVLSGGRIFSNTASNDGGGVYAGSGSSATLNGGQIFSNTTTSGDGGGIYNLNGTLTLVNSTVSGNRAGDQGGGLYHNGGASMLIYTTVASNTAHTAGGGIRGGSAITLQNSIVAYNGADNCVGTLTSNGHNLDSGVTCGFTASGDITGTDPLLGSLVEDGGTLVHPLLEGSPAIDEGLCLPGVTTIDQRGVTRPQGAGCDIGAYELAEYKVYLPLVLKN